MCDLDDWDFDLPEGAIARHPCAERDGARLLTVPRSGGAVGDHAIRELPRLLSPGDLLVANNTRVMAARLHAHRQSGGAVELLLLGLGPGPIPALAKPLRRLKDGEVLTLDGGGTATLQRGPDGLHLLLDTDPVEVMATQGRLPLPPYLDRAEEPSDRTRYQTIYAGPLGAAAAPTAGLHFSPALLEALGRRGVGWATLTLHVGLGTFQPLRPEDLARGTLHSEHYQVPAATIAAMRDTRARGGRVIAIGTTSARALESATAADAALPRPGPASTNLFVQPPYRFRAIDGLLTNFHLPRTSLLMLVAALCGRQRLLDAYAHAIRTGYRFYSYGDAMLLL